jgi:hypothetical protein
MPAASTVPPPALAAACLDVMVMGNFSKSESEAPVSFCTSSLKLDVSACTKVVVDAIS